MRSSSSIGSCASLTESIGEWTSADIADDDPDESDGGLQLRSRLVSVGSRDSPVPSESSHQNWLVNIEKASYIAVCLTLSNLLVIVRKAFLGDVQDCSQKHARDLYLPLTKQIESPLGMHI